MDYALSFNICYCSRILNSRENLQRNSDAFSRFTLLLAPSPDVHSDSPPCKQYHPKLPCSNWFRFFYGRHTAVGAAPACPIMPVLGKGP